MSIKETPRRVLKRFSMVGQYKKAITAIKEEERKDKNKYIEENNL